MKQNKGLVAFIAVIVIAVAVSVFQIVHPNLTSDSAGTSSPSDSISTVFKDIPAFSNVFNSKNASPNYPYIARLYITGTIQPTGDSYNQEWLLDTIDQLQEDKNNLAIALYIDSPGGTVYEADEAYLRLLEYAEYKPVYAYFASMAASGGYYIGCASKYIMANRNCWTGSIGVIAGQFIDLTGLMEKYGVKSKTIHSGRNKIMGNYDEPFNEEQQAIMQALCDECYEQFTGIVAKSRKLPIEKVKTLADGRVYTAKQAKENKLIDAVGSWEDLLDTIAAAEFDDVYYDVVDYSYEPELGFYDYLMGAVDKIGNLKAEKNAGLPDAVQKIIEPDITYPAYIYRR